MRRRLSTLACVALIAAPVSLVACGDDDGDDRPGGSAGKASAGEAGDDGGGTAGKAGGAAGKSSGGGGSSAGMTGEAGMAGEPTVAGAGSGGGGGAPPTGCDLSGEGLERVELPAEIDADLTLENDVVHVISGEVWVMDGATLTIPPCTRLEGMPDPGVLAVLRGGRIVAEGTADEPILFTSAEPVGSRAAGDWGGVVMLGRAPITRPAGATEAIYEGLTAAEYTYGGDDPEDDSGVLRFVRIEFGGWEIFPDKEVNGLSMAGVGSGTVIDHVMINNTLDDCFEWWGGTVGATHLIANNCGDDHFDGDEGWSGSVDFLLGRSDIDAVDSGDPNGFELDSINDGTTPRTAFAFSNATLCGTGEGSGQTNPQLGMMLRELVTGEFDNLALLGFEFGINTRDAFTAGDVTISNSTFWELLSGVGSEDATDDDDQGFDDASVFTDGTDNVLDPDPAPFTVEDCLADGGPTEAVIASGIGAFPDADAVEAWQLDGLWVDWSED